MRKPKGTSSLALWVGGTMLAFSATNAMAGLVTVLPSDLGSPGDLNTWYLTNYRTTPTYSSTTVAEISNSNPRSGNGSVEMSLTDGSGKADFQYVWGYNSNRTLGNLTALGLDWYRDSTSTNPSAQAPALRMFYDADGDSGTTADTGYLIWEYTYTNGTPPTDSWITSNAIGDNFWMRMFASGTTIELFDKDLSEWATGSPFTDGANNISDTLSDSTAILGIDFGIGSGWNGEFLGYVDNVTFGFSNEEQMTFNFETAGNVPEPATLLLMGLGLAGMGCRRRRIAA